MDEMKSYKRRFSSQRGMAMLAVLFVVIMIAIVTSDFIARSDASLASGRNLCIRNEVDYAAWGALEAAWALMQDPNVRAALPYSAVAQQLDDTSQIYYELSIECCGADPNLYPVECRAYKRVNADIKARSVQSVLKADLKVDPNSMQIWYASIRRQ
ncbi:MAG TPA: hypothetical protein PK525_04310 [Anaerohalosphaeraceae bacterium]|nr:hypothetical protein [Anaerohalosphaeraceae bacterium]HPC63822.1 hypothetical protein [Anaerohalosphaeraceae bacterium]